MVLLDVNVLVYAHREDTTQHQAYHAWLEQLLNSHQSYGLSDVVLSGFIRVVTHPRIFKTPSTMDEALAFTGELRDSPNCTLIHPGARHWEIFCDLCRRAGVKGNLVPDAFLAALAIESGSEWITADQNFHRFPGLRVRHPLA